MGERSGQKHEVLLGACVSEARSQRSHLEQAAECWTKQGLIINPIASFLGVPGKENEHVPAYSRHQRTPGIVHPASGITAP